MSLALHTFLARRVHDRAPMPAALQQTAWQAATEKGDRDLQESLVSRPDLDESVRALVCSSGSPASRAALAARDDATEEQVAAALGPRPSAALLCEVVRMGVSGGPAHQLVLDRMLSKPTLGLAQAVTSWGVQDPALQVAAIRVILEHDREHEAELSCAARPVTASPLLTGELITELLNSGRFDPWALELLEATPLDPALLERVTLEAAVGFVDAAIERGADWSARHAPSRAMHLLGAMHGNSPGLAQTLRAVLAPETPDAAFLALDPAVVAARATAWQAFTAATGGAAQAAAVTAAKRAVGGVPVADRVMALETVDEFDALLADVPARTRPEVLAAVTSTRDLPVAVRAAAFASMLEHGDPGLMQALAAAAPDAPLAGCLYALDPEFAELDRWALFGPDADGPALVVAAACRDEDQDVLSAWAACEPLVRALAAVPVGNAGWAQVPWPLASELLIGTKYQGVSLSEFEQLTKALDTAFLQAATVLDAAGWETLSVIEDGFDGTLAELVQAASRV